jgi:CRP-like cAMP-binding protein
VNTAHLVGPYERLILLKALALFSHPPADAMGALAGQAAECHFAAGTNLPTAGGPWEEAHVVVEGRVQVMQEGRPLYAAGPKQAFGLIETLARLGTDVVQARAEIETVTLAVRLATLFSILEDHQALTLGTVRALARMLLTTPAWLAGVVAEQQAPVSGVVLTDQFDLVDRIRRLQRSDVFIHARVDSLAELASQYERFEAAAGTTLWREGDPGHWLLVLTGGHVASASAAGQSLAWAAGTSPGLFDALAGVRWHDAIAITPVTGFRLSADRLFDALEDDFAMAADVLAALATLVRTQRQALTFSPGAEPLPPHLAA